MSAAVCGKRSFFEENRVSPPSLKRIRCGAGSPIKFAAPGWPLRAAAEASTGAGSSTTVGQALVALRAAFPDMDAQVLQEVFEKCGNNIDAAIRSLNELRLSTADSRSGDYLRHKENSTSLVSYQETASPSAEEAGGSSPGTAGVPGNVGPGVQHAAEGGRVQEDDKVRGPDGMEWVELLVQEMMTCVDVSEARSKAARILEAFEKVALERGLPAAGIVESLQKENAGLRDHVTALAKDNHILKRAVAIQHERGQQESDTRAREVQELRALLAQYQDQLRTLEVNNYALNLHLKMAQESSSMPSRFHPDVF
eukprot:jgi/Mesen1/887/ME000115S00010